ncbi:hypothetical protein EMIHUDRAFT_439114 [Emiliania huxleyi CCMP1516]|uniref:Uncharacterized protein n=2 Tax=Emiliania huxleyi TaxID=2903 RepID=A0A0D3I0A6_EMIH1|nr:hypothetical protein EMIHUDRAFT_439114 [Emiliania huxleyi CCMP1516]EOD04691.1 hypothetical protein EMIHUDRAFT_439114 [Emiliania huxleyi CCMP1516]|eukprot:XP_005757120.1 hypothetical protein EMIHUDRAFT_439114 [Emiliania huxleyi CCMP1516]
MRARGRPTARASCRWTQPRCPTSRSRADAPRATTSQLVADRGSTHRCFRAPAPQRAPAALPRRVTAADIMYSVVPASAELRHVDLFGGSTAGRSFSPRRRSERPTLPRAAIKQAQPDENPPGRSWPSHRRPPCRLTAAQKVGRPALAGRGAPSHR